MYELAILCQLLTRPMHGYLIAKILNDTIGPYARISSGRLYPLLAKLQENGLIELTKESPGNRGERPSKAFRITDAGRQRWHQLMMDTTSNPGDYTTLFMRKVGYLKLLPPDERLYLIDHYINYCQAHILHLVAESDDLRQRSEIHEHLPGLDDLLDSMQHLIDKWQLELAWTRGLRARYCPTAENV